MREGCILVAREPELVVVFGHDLRDRLSDSVLRIGPVLCTTKFNQQDISYDIVWDSQG